MPAPQVEASQSELIKVLRNNATSSREYIVAKDLLELKHQEELVRQTKTLSFYTAVLAFATIVLVAATTFSAYITWISKL